MKTTLKQTIDEFDESYVADDRDIYDSSDLDIEKITRNVKLRIAAEGEHKSKRSKLPVILVAAAVSTAVIGTTAIAAGISGIEKFSDVVRGESTAFEVVENDSFRFESDDKNLRADFLGILGDEQIAYAAIELSTKDGSSFIEDQDGFFTMNYPSYSGSYADDNFDNFVLQNEASFRCSVIPAKGENTDDPDRLINNTVYYVPGDTPDKIKVYIRLESPDKNNSLSGATVNYQSNYIYLYKLGEAVGEGHLIEGNASRYPEEFQNRLIEESIPLESLEISSYGELSTAYIRFMTEGIEKSATMWDTSESVYKLRRVDQIKRHDIPFKVSFTVDQLSSDKNITIEMNSKNAPNTLKDNNKISITITPFYADIFFNEDNSFIFDNFDSVIDFKNALRMSEFNGSDCAEIVLKNGNSYYFDLLGEAMSAEKINDNSSESFNKLEVKFADSKSKFRDSKSPLEKDLSAIFKTENYIKKETIIDPTNISKIIINGDTVYSAE